MGQKRFTVEPRFYDMARGQQNHIVKSGHRCKRTPDLTIWRKSNQKYRCVGKWLTIDFSKCNQ